jgi:DNA ligase-associated metallophosphoesterase
VRLGFTEVVLNFLETNMCGETLQVLSARALYWPRADILFVADIHLGKAAAYRARSVPLPHGTTDAAFARLDAVLEETGAKRLVVLGDLWHDKLGRSEALLEKLGKWTAGHAGVEFTLVTGNHDLKTGKTPLSSGFVEVEELWLSPFCCLHHPIAREGIYVLCGHIHPGLRMGVTNLSVTAPCFWFGPHVGILPAFGEFTGVAPVCPEPGDKVFVVAEDTIISVGGSRAGSLR